MARPQHKPTPAQRRTVSIAAGGGMSHYEIALAIGIDKGTLEKHYEFELSTGAMKRRAEVVEAMHKAAAKGNVSAQRAYLERTPQLGLPPLPTEPEKPAKGEKLGKKAQAAQDAATAAAGTGWDGLLPSPGIQ